MIKNKTLYKCFCDGCKSPLENWNKEDNGWKQSSLDLTSMLLEEDWVVKGNNEHYCSYCARELPLIVEKQKEKIQKLSERELQVLNYMSWGHSNPEIAKKLYLSEDTIKSHARRLFSKLEVSDRAAAASKGLREGLIK